MVSKHNLLILEFVVQRKVSTYCQLLELKKYIGVEYHWVWGCARRVNIHSSCVTVVLQLQKQNLEWRDHLQSRLCEVSGWLSK